MVGDRHYDFVNRYFQYAHLPDHLQPISRPFHELAQEMLAQVCYDDDELMAGLRRLLEAKDCAVRAAMM